MRSKSRRSMWDVTVCALNKLVAGCQMTVMNKISSFFSQNTEIRYSLHACVRTCAPYQGRTVVSPYVGMAREQDGGSNGHISNYTTVTRLGASVTLCNAFLSFSSAARTNNNNSNYYYYYLSSARLAL